MDSANDKIREIRLQLRRAKPSDGKDINPLISEIYELGAAGSALIPELIETINRGCGYPAQITLVPVIVQHKSAALLEAAMKRWGDNEIGVHDMAKLFSAGFIQFQGKLLEYLRDSFDCDDNPARLSVIRAFAESGTMSLTQDLEDVESWCARRVKDMQADDPQMSETEQFISKLEAESRKEFLGKLREAIARVHQRPDLAPVEPSRQPAGAPATGEQNESNGRASAEADSVVDPSLQQLSIHPEVARHAQGLLASGNYFHAVFEAAKAYDKAVAVLAKSSKHGADLMFDALSKKGLLKITPCTTETDNNVQEGAMHLSVGLMRVVRNPTAHEPAIDWPMSRQDALDLLALISFLYRQLDKAAALKDDTG